MAFFSADAHKTSISRLKNFSKPEIISFVIDTFLSLPGTDACNDEAGGLT